jgi:sporulation protein YlmC with PRC-barrel domain
MEIEFGTEVIDKYGKVLGTVDHLVRNTWTGEISKFMVRRKAPDSDLLFSPQDVLEVTNDTVKLNLSIDELSEKHKL